MARVEFGEPPSLGDKAKYPDYRPWLDRALYLRICGYCLLRNLHLHIDHFEPQRYAPARVHDPTNLVLGCQACNGPGGKSDYHPLHTRRTRLPQDTSGHCVVDIRADDFALLFQIASDGKISARSGPSKTRADWNIVLLNLQRDIYNTVRAQNLETLTVAEKVLQRLMSADVTDKETVLEELLEMQVKYVARMLPFFDAFGIAITAELRARVEVMREAELRSLD